MNQTNEVFVIPISQENNSDKNIIFRPLTGLAFVGNDAMANIAVAENSNPSQQTPFPEAVEFLKTIGFYEPDPPKPQIKDSAFFPTTAILLLTNQCQLRCTYCYASAGEKQPKELTFDHGKSAIDLAHGNAESSGVEFFNVSFHGGGEPILAWDIFKRLTAYARSQKLPARISLTSNGIWSHSQTDWLLSNIDEFSISMDGSPDSQNRQRPLTSGGSSSDIVMRTISELDLHNIRYGIRMTAVSPWQNFPKDIAYLCSETNCQSFQVEPAFNVNRGGHHHPEIEDAVEFSKAFIQAFEIAHKSNRLLSYSGSRIGMVTKYFCTAPYEAVIINPEGHIVSCYEIGDDSHPLADISTFGKIQDDKITLDLKKRDHLHKMIEERQETCKNCFCYWSCAGDCYSRSFSPGSKGHLEHNSRCEINRMITKELLLWFIAENDGIWQPDRLEHLPLTENLEQQPFQSAAN